MHFTKGELLKGSLGLFDHSNKVETFLTVFLVLGIHENTGDYILYDVRDFNKEPFHAFYDIAPKFLTNNKKESLYFKAIENSYVYIEQQGHYIDIPVSYDEINISNRSTICERILREKKKIHNLALNKTSGIYVEAWV